MRLLNRLGLGGFCAVALASASVSGSVLTQFGFTGNVGNETSVSPSNPTPGISGSPITRGPGYAVEQYTSFTANSFGVNPSPSPVFQASYASADAAGQYVLFTLTPTTGSVASLTDVVFDVGIQNGPNGGTISPGLEYSTDGSTFTPVNSVTYSGGNGGFSTPNIGTFDLSGIAALQADVLPVSFRLYILDTGSNNYEDGNFGRSPTGITVDGTVASVPETATISGFACAVAACLTRRRRSEA